MACTWAPSQVDRLVAALVGDEVDVELLRRLVREHGVPEEGNLRAVVWKVLMGYLPPEKRRWEKTLLRKRSEYDQFRQDFKEGAARPDPLALGGARTSDGDGSAEATASGRGRSSPDIFGPGRERLDESAHPLSMDPKSSWQVHFRDEETRAQIARDVERTHPDLNFFGGSGEDAAERRASLRRALFAFAKLNPGLGYVQGMNELLAPFLFVYGTSRGAVGAREARGAGPGRPATSAATAPPPDGRPAAPAHRDHRSFLEEHGRVRPEPRAAPPAAGRVPAPAARAQPPSFFDSPLGAFQASAFGKALQGSDAGKEIGNRIQAAAASVVAAAAAAGAQVGAAIAGAEHGAAVGPGARRASDSGSGPTRAAPAGRGTRRSPANRPGVGGDLPDPHHLAAPGAGVAPSGRLERSPTAGDDPLSGPAQPGPGPTGPGGAGVGSPFTPAPPPPDRRRQPPPPSPATGADPALDRALALAADPTAAEADAFWSLVALMGEFRDGYCQALDDSGTGIKATLRRLHARLAAADAPLGVHLDGLGVTPQMYGFRWVTLALTQEFDFPDAVRLWDCGLVCAPPGTRLDCLLDLCVAMLLLVRDDLIRSDFPAAVKTLQRYPPIDVALILRVVDALAGKGFSQTKAVAC